MFALNEGLWDRLVRTVVGVVLLVLGLTGVVGGWVAAVLMIIGAVLLVTGLAGRCPLYTVFGWDTRPAAAQKPGAAH